MPSLAWLVILLCATAALTATDVARPYELVLNRNTGTLQCTFLSVRQTQLFRALSDEGYTKSRLLPTGGERIQYIVAEEGHVWERAESICGEQHTWNFQTLFGRGVRPAVGYNAMEVGSAQDDPLPLQIEPIVTSGHSSNRVDLVFFGDGCMSQPVVHLLQLNDGSQM